MKLNIFLRVQKSDRSITEQTDAQNYHTFIEEYTRSGRLPTATGLPLGSFDHQDENFEVDVDDVERFQEDRADRYIKYRTQAQQQQVKKSEPEPNPIINNNTDPTPTGSDDS